ncbi:MAG: SPASM domain-containing protein [Faecalicoccus sp.]|nr:SPASM domain-containing protein [Faecalicoccus sp.]
MKTISVLIKPASSLCNLRCRYCFYADVSQNREVSSQGVMKEDTLNALVDGIYDYIGQDGVANISFQGGEPTVAGIDYFKEFAELVDQKKMKVNWSMQTNGTLLNDDFARFFKEHKFLLGISLDGYKQIHDRNRYDARKQGAFDRVLKGIELFEKHGVEYNILTVVTRQLSRHPKELFDFYKNHKFQYIQLIPCLPELDGNDPSGLALRAGEYASFYNSFFDAWKKEIQSGGFMSINLFENVQAMLMGQSPYQCGMIGHCSKQFVIEGNGDVYPCDFYCLDEWKLGNVKEDNFDTMQNSINAKRFIETSQCKKAPCDKCKYVGICSGGCRRQNVCYLTDSFCAYKKVLDHIVSGLVELTRQMR